MKSARNSAWIIILDSERIRTKMRSEISEVHILEWNLSIILGVKWLKILNLNMRSEISEVHNFDWMNQKFWGYCSDSERTRTKMKSEIEWNQPVILGKN